MEKKKEKKYNLRDIGQQYAFPMVTLFCHTKQDATKHTTLVASCGRSRKKRLTTKEKEMIGNVAIAFQKNGTPVDSSPLHDLVQVFVNTLLKASNSSVGFKINWSGNHWIKIFMTKSQILTLRKHVNPGRDPAEEMSLQNMATHFARIESLINKYDIPDPTRIFKMDK